jgi:hypothetical protein
MNIRIFVTFDGQPNHEKELYNSEEKLREHAKKDGDIKP